jgi:serine/threonine protein kinase
MKSERTERRPSAEIIYKGTNSTTLRVYSETLNTFIIHKKHNDEFPSIRERNKFLKEVRMGQKLYHRDYIVKYIGKEGTGKDEIIIMEDFAAISLETAIAKNVRRVKIFTNV